MRETTILTIDTSQSEVVWVAIEGKGLKKLRRAINTPSRAQAVLPMIAELLKEKKLKLSDVGKIKVHTGPGSFTGLRVGVAIANMLATLLSVPINDLPVGKLVAPRYT